jgi:hypothetical protein
MSEYTNRGKTSAKRNSGRKSALTERGRRTLKRIVQRNHTATAAQVTELNIHLEDYVLTKKKKKNRREFHKSSIHERIATALITESNAQMRK